MKLTTLRLGGTDGSKHCSNHSGKGWQYPITQQD
jgi:hypothetical protein